MFPSKSRAAEAGLAMGRFSCPRGLRGSLESESSDHFCHSHKLADLKVVQLRMIRSATARFMATGPIIQPQVPSRKCLGYKLNN